MSLSYATITDTGRVRPANEDSLFALPPLFMVADGMGGAHGGEVASARAAEVFSLADLGGDEGSEKLAELVREANRQIYELAVSDANLHGMGTTVTAALVRGDAVHLAHVGDSRAYRWRLGILKQLTEDHSLVGEMLRRGSISEEEAEVHPQRSIITRALGIEPGVEVDTDAVDWQPGDVFLLCSDGLSSMLNDEELAAVLARGESLEQTARALVEAANARGGRDNITVILFSPAEVLGNGARRGAEAAASAAVENGAGGARQDSGTRRSSARRQSRGIRQWLLSTWGRVTIALLAGVALLAGFWLINRNVYYVGADGSNVAIYRGLPVELGPLNFSSVFKVSSVRLDEMDAIDRGRMSRHELQSLNSAEDTVANYLRNIEERDQNQQPATGATGTATGAARATTGSTATSSTTGSGS